jgi:hypothetical protein
VNYLPGVAKQFIVAVLRGYRLSAKHFVHVICGRNYLFPTLMPIAHIRERQKGFFDCGELPHISEPTRNHFALDPILVHFRFFLAKNAASHLRI